MTTDINTLIDFFKKYTPNTDIKGEVEEQDGDAASTEGGGGTVPKWSDSYVTNRGKANMLGKAGEKWNTGINRGAANQIW